MSAMLRTWLWLSAAVLAIAYADGSASSSSVEFRMGGHLDNKREVGQQGEPTRQQQQQPSYAAAGAGDLVADESEESTVEVVPVEGEPRFRLPAQFAFNGGKPFSLEKDPITGRIDFDKAPPLKALNYTSSTSYDDEEEGDSDSSSETINTKTGNVDVTPNEINPYSPNFHDFLNLPVRYTSDKYERDNYPLISSSYANTKVQSGSNSYNTYNHRPYHKETPTSKPYVELTRTKKPYVNIQRTTSTETSVVTSSSASSSSTSAPPRTTTTTQRATTKVSTTTKRPTTTTTTTPASTRAPTTKPAIITTWKPPHRVSSSTSSSSYDYYEETLPIEKLQEDTQYHNNKDRYSNEAIPVSYHDDYYDTAESHVSSNGNSNNNNNNGIIHTTKSSTLAPSTTTTTVYPSPTTSSRPATTTTTTHSPSTTTTTRATTTQSPPLSTTTFSTTTSTTTAAPPTSQTIVNRLEPQWHLGGMPVESTSSIIVPPDQDTVSFVLGNRQNVQEGHYGHGFAVEESPYLDMTKGGPFKPLYGSVSSAPLPVAINSPSDNSNKRVQQTVALPSISAVPPLYNANDHQTSNNWWPPSKTTNEIDATKTVSTMVTFPKDPPPVVVGSQEDVKIETVDSNGGHVVFPDSVKGDSQPPPPRLPTEEHVVIINEADGTIQEFVTSSTNRPSSAADHVQEFDNGGLLPQLADSLTPPAKRPSPNQRPPHYFHYHHHPAHPPPHTSGPPSRRPSSPPRGKPLPYDGNVKRRPDFPLPNILPQFRPNSKASHGHRGSEVIGTLPAGQAFNGRPRPPHPSRPPVRRPPQYAPVPAFMQRLNPPMPPPPPPVHSLRINGVPPPPPPPPLVKTETEIKRFRPTPSPDDERPKFQQKLRTTADDDRPEQFADTKNYQFQPEISSPPQVPPRPVLFPKRRHAELLPRVATLQMIHQQVREDDETETNKDDSSLSIEDEAGSSSSSDSTDVHEAEKRKDNNNNVSMDNRVYVVYPVNSAVTIRSDNLKESEENVVIGSQGSQRPGPPHTLHDLQQDEDNNEQNNDEKFVEQEDTAVQKKKPDTSGQFPYKYELPDSNFPVLPLRPQETPLLVSEDELLDNEGSLDSLDTSVNVIPNLQDTAPYSVKSEGAISTTLQRVSPGSASSSPIAYVYTPTAPQASVLRVDSTEDGGQIYNYDRVESEKPVLLPSQQPSSSSSSAPSPQNFMAPFVASVSVENPSENGWSVVKLKKDIDRIGTDGEDDDKPSGITADETQTERNVFDPDSFKPEYMGGFKPFFGFNGDEQSSQDKIVIES